MDVRSIDWRISTTRSILLALNAGLYDALDQLAQASQQETYWVDPDDLFDFAESIYGIAFVCCQTHITGTVADLQRFGIPDDTIVPSKHELISHYGERIPNSSITKVHLCHLMANYYKHSEEGLHGSTKDLLSQASIEVDGDFKYPYYQAARLLLPASEEDLVPLADILSIWRAAVVASFDE